MSDNENKCLSDNALWKAMTKDVKKMPGKDYQDIGEPEPIPDKTPQERVVMHVKKEEPKQRLGQDLDRKTEARLRKGQIRPEAKLDMHGMSQGQAHEALTDFIRKSHSQGKRCVLVVTGKGLGNRPVTDSDMFAPKIGVLKERTPEWLSADDMRPFVIKFVAAQQKDGGEGALYVYLRRQRL